MADNIVEGLTRILSVGEEEEGTKAIGTRDMQNLMVQVMNADNTPVPVKLYPDEKKSTVDNIPGRSNFYTGASSNLLLIQKDISGILGYISKISNFDNFQGLDLIKNNSDEQSNDVEYLSPGRNPTVDMILRYRENLSSVIPAGFILLHNDLIENLEKQKLLNGKETEETSLFGDLLSNIFGSAGQLASLLTGVLPKIFPALIGTTIAVAVMKWIGDAQQEAKEDFAAKSMYTAAKQAINEGYSKEREEAHGEYDSKYLNLYKELGAEEAAEYFKKMRDSIFEDEQGKDYGFWYGVNNTPSVELNNKNTINGLGYLLSKIDDTAFEVFTQKINDITGIDISSIDRNLGVEEIIQNLNNLGLSYKDLTNKQLKAIRNDVISDFTGDFNLFGEIHGFLSDSRATVIDGILSSEANGVEKLAIYLRNNWEEFLKEGKSSIENVVKIVDQDGRLGAEQLNELYNQGNIIANALDMLNIDVSSITKLDKDEEALKIIALLEGTMQGVMATPPALPEELLTPKESQENQNQPKFDLPPAEPDVPDFESLNMAGQLSQILEIYEKNYLGLSAEEFFGYEKELMSKTILKMEVIKKAIEDFSPSITIESPVSEIPTGPVEIEVHEMTKSEPVTIEIPQIKEALEKITFNDPQTLYEKFSEANLDLFNYSEEINTAIPPNEAEIQTAEALIEIVRQLAILTQTTEGIRENGGGLNIINMSGNSDPGLG